MGEIGKNLFVIEYRGERLIIDAGLAFPDEDMPGVDIVIPDVSYLMERKESIRGILLTHGHEDHVGALGYLLRDLDVPVFALPLTIGLVREKLREHQVELHPDSRACVSGNWFQRGIFRILPFRVTHSIPDSCGYGIETPEGIVVHTGDYKFDQTPVDGRPPDFQAIGELGRRGVKILLGDSTNAERPGVTPSEREVGHVLQEVIGRAPGRVFVATFASNIHRIQQVLQAAKDLGRKVTVLGRSMETTVRVANAMGYLRGADEILIPPDKLDQLRPEQCVVLTTGSQGEPLSALTRMASGEHRWVVIGPGDTVVIAATPVPGNEKLVHRTVNNLFHLGASVIYGSEEGVHVSGHGSREELKLMINLLRPRFLIPIHGEFRHMSRHADLARETGIPDERILLGNNGDVFGFRDDQGTIVDRVRAGSVLVDGLVVGDVGKTVLRDRRQLAEHGVLVVVAVLDRNEAKIVSGPEVISRGFVYMRESEELLEETRERARTALIKATEEGSSDWNAVKGHVRENLQNFLYQKTHRRPVILPIVMEI